MPSSPQMNIATLPSSLEESLNELEGDPLLHKVLGEHTYQRFLEIKRSEWHEYRRQVTQWELDRYLEVL